MLLGDCCASKLPLEGAIGAPRGLLEGPRANRMSSMGSYGTVDPSTFGPWGPWWGRPLDLRTKQQGSSAGDITRPWGSSDFHFGFGSIVIIVSALVRQFCVSNISTFGLCIWPFCENTVFAKRSKMILFFSNMKILQTR